MPYCSLPLRNRLVGAVQPIPREEIQKDTVIEKVLDYKARDHRPSGKALQAEDNVVQALLREWNKLNVEQDGTLHHKTVSRCQLVLPKVYLPLVFKELHKDMGHVGTERTMNFMRDRFYSPKMQRDVEHIVANVCGYLKNRNRTDPHGPP